MLWYAVSYRKMDIYLLSNKIVIRLWKLVFFALQQGMLGTRNRDSSHWRTFIRKDAHLSFNAVHENLVSGDSKFDKFLD